MNNAIYFYVSEHSLNGVLLHKSGCHYLPGPTERVFIGTCYSPAQALTVSRNRFPDVKYCPYCLPRTVTNEAMFHMMMCHTSKPQPKAVKHLDEKEQKLM